MMPTGVRYAPDVASYDDLKNTNYASQHLQRNEKRDQVNLRLTRAFHQGGWNNELGGSLAASRLYNRATGDNGSFWAAGLHTLVNYDPGICPAGDPLRLRRQRPGRGQQFGDPDGGNGLTPAYLIRRRPPPPPSTGARRRRAWGR